jgi:dolichyl-phosphate-mannose-protein mannosyltransferase
LWALCTGGFRVHVLGLPVSVRGADRAALVALILGGIGLYLDVPLQHRLRGWTRALPLPPLVPTIVGAAVIAMLWVSLAMGTRAAGGSDVYGYVSQSALWRHGNLKIHQPIAAAVPWPDADWTFAPLGYKPAPDHTIVPTYSPGLPLLMALFAAIFGSGAEFYVVPICGAVLVWLTYALGKRVSGDAAGTIAALAVAASPCVLFMTLWTMSDVPVATFWTASLLLAMRATAWRSLLAGIAAGIAIVVRPNLAPLALVPLLLVTAAAVRATEEHRKTQTWLGVLVCYCMALVPFVVFVGWLFNDLYGSPLRSGYGDAADIYSRENVLPNLARYARWFFESQGPLPLLFLASPFIRGGRTDVRPYVGVLFILFIAIVLACYLPYLRFDDWWYVRFLIPAFPLMFILAADAVLRLSSRATPAARAAIMAALALGLAGYGLRESLRRDVFAIGHGEQKYAEVGRYAAQLLPPNAVVYSMQHSGSVRYYSNRLTLRLDYLDPQWLDRSIDYLRAAGYDPYFIVDDWEVPMFTERFRTQKTIGAIANAPPAAPCTHTTFVYRIGEPPFRARVPQVEGCR